MKEEVYVEALLKFASQFAGLKEVKPNAAWDKPSTPGADTDLSNLLISIMRPSPWEKGWAYCAAFVEGCVIETLKSLGVSSYARAKVASVLSPHCVTTYNNFKREGLISSIPTRGSIWIARKDGSSSGHMGFVRQPSGPTMATLEANTSAGEEADADKIREGDWIDFKIRSVKRNGNLLTLGFIDPSAILDLIS